MDVREKTVMGMAEYIDREAAIKIAESYGLKNGSALGRHSGIADCIAEAISIIPSADVAPVRHGRWIDKGEYAVCTECDGRSGTQYDGVEPIPLTTQFCPNCGCHMDGGAD